MVARSGNKVLLLVLAFFFLGAIVVWRLSEDPELFSQFTNSGAFVGKTITIHRTRIAVGVADTEAERRQGLSGRVSLGSGTGLLMVFEKDSSPGIWMKDMNFPIDIVWIDRDLKVIQVTPSVAPDTYPQVFYPDSPVKYVLELPAGFSDIHNIQAGDIVED